MALSELVSFLFESSFEIRKDLAEYKSDALQNSWYINPRHCPFLPVISNPIFGNLVPVGQFFRPVGHGPPVGQRPPVGHGPRATGGPAADGGVHSSAAECAGVRSAAKLICHLLLPVSVAARRGFAPPPPPAPRGPAIVSRGNSGVSGFGPSGGWIYCPGRSY